MSYDYRDENNILYAEEGKVIINGVKVDFFCSELDYLTDLMDEGEYCYDGSESYLSFTDLPVLGVNASEVCLTSEDGGLMIITFKFSKEDENKLKDAIKRVYGSDCVQEDGPDLSRYYIDCYELVIKNDKSASNTFTMEFGPIL